MAEQAEHTTVVMSDAGKLVTSAEVTTTDDAEMVAHASLHAEAGHLPLGSRAKLVDAVLDLPAVQASKHLEATLALGDFESMHRLDERTTGMTTRAAGSSALVEADLVCNPAEHNAPIENEDDPRSHPAAAG